MGVRPSVSCRCFVDGLSVPPPGVPRERLRVNDLGYLWLDLPYVGHTEEHGRFREWQATGCPHPDQHQATFKFRWATISGFREEVEAAGAELYPTLLAELPQFNGPHTAARRAPAMLAELRAFRDQLPNRPATFLVNADTGAPIGEDKFAIDEEWAGLSMGIGIVLGFDRRGFFVGQWEPRSRQLTELFRASRLAQYFPEGEPEFYERVPVDYVNLDSGRTFRCDVPITDGEIPWPDGRLSDDEGRGRYRYPREMRVERRDGAVRSARFMARLEALCLASIDTGNPIWW